jgi:hypothetical protein
MASEDELIRVRFKDSDRRKLEVVKKYNADNDSDALRYCVRFTYDMMLNSGQIPPDFPVNKDLAFKLLKYLYPGKEDDFEDLKNDLGKPASFSVPVDEVI